jgi:putative Ca2+/H+ antiporter (TMEM165/GDT1 family)
VDPASVALSVFSLVFLLELPDKTALAVVLLSTRHPPLPVLIGAALAFAVQTLVAVFAGSLFGLLPRDLVRIAAGLLFLLLAFILLRRNLRRVEIEEEREVAIEERRVKGRPLLVSFTVVFLAEWGDLTQLATAALQARYRQPLVVFLAALLALWSVSGLAVVVGNRLGSLVPERPLQIAAAVVMAAAGLALLTGLLG